MTDKSKKQKLDESPTFEESMININSIIKSNNKMKVVVDTDKSRVFTDKRGTFQEMDEENSK